MVLTDPISKFWVADPWVTAIVGIAFKRQMIGFAQITGVALYAAIGDDFNSTNI